MLRRYIPGKGYINLGVKDNKVKIIKSYSTISGICDLGSRQWTSDLLNCSSSNCYSFPNLDGGTPSSIPQLFMNGEDPFTIPVCFINGGNP
jgi:hypothetical protein